MSVLEWCVNTNFFFSSLLFFSFWEQVSELAQLESALESARHPNKTIDPLTTHKVTTPQHTHTRTFIRRNNQKPNLSLSTLSILSPLSSLLSLPLPHASGASAPTISSIHSVRTGEIYRPSFRTSNLSGEQSRTG